jgi:hypothetical protein
VLITNSNVKHRLTGGREGLDEKVPGSEYPARRAACLDSAKLLGQPSLR